MKRMMVRSLLLSLLLMILSLPGQSQIKALQIGDMLPDLVINAANAGISNGRLSDYRGKLVILDFWSNNCSYCIESMPEMEKLQRDFGRAIQIIFITHNTAEEVNRLKARSANVRNLQLPCITDDSIFCQYFPMKFFPNHVWLDSTGRVIQITSGTNTSAATIKSWLNGNQVQLPVHKEQTDFDYRAPLWSEGNGRHLSGLRFYSLLSDPIDYRTTGFSKTDSATGKLVWLHLINYSIYYMYRSAFCRQYNIMQSQFNKRCVVFSKRKDKIITPSDLTLHDNWGRLNNHCYEINVPPERSGELFQLMRQDLDRYFNLKTTVVNKKVKCLVLKRISSIDKLSSKNATVKPLAETGPEDIVIYHSRISQSLMLELQGLHPETIVLDETGYKEPVDIYISKEKKDPGSLRQELRRYGLALIPATRTVKVLYIKDRL